jgi:TIR domain
MTETTRAASVHPAASPSGGDTARAHRVFVSHISDEAAVAELVRVSLQRDFLRLLDVFASSDTESIGAGDDWLAALEDALRGASLFLVLCSPTSVHRPWPHFEAGAAWIQGVPVVPLCHAGLRPSDLPMPLSTRQGVALDTAEGVERLYARLARLAGCAPPSVDHARLASAVSAAERKASGDDVVRLEADRHLQERLVQALRHERFPWRTLERVAAEAAVPSDVAAASLRGRPDVRFSRGKKGGIIVGLRDRVGS